jgi:opacity protein-like surface antigen
MKSLLSTAVLLAAALLLGSAPAHAQPVHWTFSYTGFQDQEAGVFQPDMVLAGAFSGDDADGDGVLEREELQSLRVGDLDYVACAAAGNASYHCGADSFLFSPAQGLSFSLGAWGSDPEGWVGGGHLIESGHMRYDYGFNPGGSSEQHLLWTEETLLRLAPLALATQSGSAADVPRTNAAAVPEPATWTMIVLGLAGIGLWTRRRR